jgi:hypothetical protein
MYAFGFLQRECWPHGALHHLAQIGIEVGVADTTKGERSLVRKDLVGLRAQPLVAPGAAQRATGHHGVERAKNGLPLR